MQRIIGSLLGVALWLTVWLSPLLLTMAAGCMLVWAVQGDEQHVLDAVHSQVGVMVHGIFRYGWAGGRGLRR